MKEFPQFHRDYYKYAVLLFVSQIVSLVIYINFNLFRELGLTQAKLHGIIEVFIGIIVLILLFSSIFVVKKLVEYGLEKQEYEINKLKFKHIEEQNTLYRQYKHDLNNHLSVLHILSRARRYDELNSYLENYTAKLASDTISVNTGLRELDALLYLKLSQSREKNLLLNFRCSPQLKCSRKQIIDLTSIIGNLLDNAIEACVHSREKILEITIKEDPLDYIFLITNTYDEKAVPAEADLFREGFSTKGTERGLGLAIVKKLTARLGGKLELDTAGGRFSITVEIPKLNLEASQ